MMKKKIERMDLVAPYLIRESKREKLYPIIISIAIILLTILVIVYLNIKNIY